MRRLQWRLLALIIATALLPKASRASTAVLGDVDGDGQVTVTDAQKTLSAAVGLSVPSLDLAAADIEPVNPDGSRGNGRIDIADALAILRLAVGLDSAASAPANPGPFPPVRIPSIQFVIDTQRGSYEPTDAVPFTVTLRNNTLKDYDWTAVTGCPVDFEVVDASGAVVWRPDQICTDIVQKMTLKPGDEQTWSFTWTQNPLAALAPRAPGIYVAYASLKGSDLKASLTFPVKRMTNPIPLPADGPPTFNLTPGHGEHFVNPSKGTEETIRFERFVQKSGQTYTVVSMTPDGRREALLRLDADGNVWQWAEAGESIRLKLNAKVGDTWTLDYGGGSKAKVTLTARDATLKTPGGIYDSLLQFDFFVGPDMTWTEWVHPLGFWAGYSRDTFIGPTDFRLVAQDFIGFTASSTPGYAASLYPSVLSVKPGEQAQLNLIVADQTGHPIADLPGPVAWSADPAIGTVDAGGLFTAKSGIDGVQGTVRATVTLKDGSSVAATGTVSVGNVPTVPPPPPVPGPPGPPGPPPIGGPTPSGPPSPPTGNPTPVTPPSAPNQLALLDGGSLTVSIPPLASPDISIEADIAGSMPDPSWSYDRTDVKVDGSTIYLSPYMKEAVGEIVAQVIVPFKAKVFVHGLRSGTTYTVVALGADTKLTAQIKT